MNGGGERKRNLQYRPVPSAISLPPKTKNKKETKQKMRGGGGAQPARRKREGGEHYISVKEEGDRDKEREKYIV